MQACRSREETLMLDVLGEVTDPGERRSWTAHLAGCAGCRLERQRMMALLANLRAAGAPPELTPAGARSMALRVRQARGERRGDPEQLGEHVLVAGQQRVCQRRGGNHPTAGEHGPAGNTQLNAMHRRFSRKVGRRSGWRSYLDAGRRSSVEATDAGPRGRPVRATVRATKKEPRS